MRAPPGPLIMASSEDCTMFRAVSAEHFRARGIPARSETLSVGRGGPLSRESLRRFEDVPRDARNAFPKERWDRPPNRYRVACDWGRSGLAPWPETPPGKPEPECPADMSFTYGAPKWERDFPCRGRPPRTGLPHIAFHKPVVSANGRYALVDTFVWYGMLGANGYICLLSRRQTDWRVTACNDTCIS